jgi:hypothetical protein
MRIYLGSHVFFSSVLLASIGRGSVCGHGIWQQHGGLSAIIGSVPLVFSGLSIGHSGYRVRPRLRTI